MRNENPVAAKGQKFIVQGDDVTMIPVGQPVVLPGAHPTSNIKDWMHTLGQVLNFIRCGCSEAVIYSVHFHSVQIGNDAVRVFERQLHEALDALSGTHADFTCDYRGEGVFGIYRIKTS